MSNVELKLEGKSVNTFSFNNIFNYLKHFKGMQQNKCNSSKKDVIMQLVLEFKNSFEVPSSLS